MSPSAERRLEVERTDRAPRTTGVPGINSRSTVPTGCKQRGAVLVVSLVMLVALTLIGLSAMNTSQMGQKLSANNQEATRAFQDAESFVANAFRDLNDEAWNTTNRDCDARDEFGVLKDEDRLAGGDEWAHGHYCFLGYSAVPNDELTSVVGVRAANYDFEGHSRTKGGMETRVHAGGYRQGTSPDELVTSIPPSTN